MAVRGMLRQHRRKALSMVRGQMFGEEIRGVLLARDLSVPHLLCRSPLLHPQVANAYVPQLTVAPSGSHGKRGGTIHKDGCREAHAPTGAQLGKADGLTAGFDKSHQFGLARRKSDELLGD